MVRHENQCAGCTVPKVLIFLILVEILKWRLRDRNEAGKSN